MKITTLAPVLLFILILSTSLKCNKDKDNPPTTLPPITQEGKNTFGCKVDGEVWVPYYKCGGTGNPCGEIVVDVYKTNNSITSPLSFSISVGQKKSDNSLTAFLIETKMNQGIFVVGNKIDSVIINYQKPVGQLYYNYNYYNKVEKFEITKLDTINKIITGVFEFTLYKSATDSIKISEGRFDLKFAACKCSN